MATASGDEDIFENFLAQRGHDTTNSSWKEDYNKKQCPDCGGLHKRSASQCSVCGWSPYQ